MVLEPSESIKGTYLGPISQSGTHRNMVCLYQRGNDACLTTGNDAFPPMSKVIELLL